MPFSTPLLMWFQHNGDSLYYSPEARQWLSENYSERWISRGREAPDSWPACSADMNSVSYIFLWIYSKINEANKIADREELWHRIQQFASELRNTPGAFEYLRVYFSCKAEFISVIMEDILITSCKKVKIKRLLIFLSLAYFLYKICYFRKVWSVAMKVQIMIAVHF
jgi:hypothetical protein